MKINGLQAEIENEGEFVILKLKMHPADFVKFVTDCNKIKKVKVRKDALSVLSIDERKKIFYDSIATYKAANEGKYPNKLYNQFYRWYTENNGKKMRLEDPKNKYFKIGSRLATFWDNVTSEEKSAMWQLEKGNIKKAVI